MECGISPWQDLCAWCLVPSIRLPNKATDKQKPSLHEPGSSCPYDVLRVAGTSVVRRHSYEHLFRDKVVASFSDSLKELTDLRGACYTQESVRHEVLCRLRRIMWDLTYCHGQMDRSDASVGGFSEECLMIERVSLRCQSLFFRWWSG